jgi:septal ring factor EnvC (AmiA/AmiB activator)
MVRLSGRCALARTQGLRGLAELCQSVERMDSELRQVDQKLRELQQNSAAIVRGGELHAKRGELTAKRDQLINRKTELSADVAKYETDLKELKRQETNQRETVEKMEKGQNLATLLSGPLFIIIPRAMDKVKFLTRYIRMCACCAAVGTAFPARMRRGSQTYIRGL